MRVQSALLIAFAVLVAVAAAANDNNCSAVSSPSSNVNFYMPSKDCVDSDASLRACFQLFTTCVSVPNQPCTALDACWTAKMRCIEGTITTSANCSAWYNSLANMKLYLLADGAYAGSNLEAACKFGLCNAADEAFNRQLRNPAGNICGVNFSAVCVAPNFDPATRGPTTAKFTVTFGGDWVALLANATKGSAEYRELEVALTKGLSRILDVLEYLITIIDIRSGSLVVDFIVEGDNVNVAALTERLVAAKNDPTLLASAFAELQVISGFPITITGVTVEDPSTPAPDSASGVSAILALLAVVAALLL